MTGIYGTIQCHMQGYLVYMSMGEKVLDSSISWTLHDGLDLSDLFVILALPMIF